jgi:hypothetical protein
MTEDACCHFVYFGDIVLYQNELALASGKRLAELSVLSEEEFKRSRKLTEYGQHPFQLDQALGCLKGSGPNLTSQSGNEALLTNISVLFS